MIIWWTVLVMSSSRKVDSLLAELHEKICGSHTEGRSLAHRAMTQGFWWQKMQRDAAKYLKRCA